MRRILFQLRPRASGATVTGELLLASFVLLVDQLSKMLVRWRLVEGQSVSVGWVRIRHVVNAGGSRRFARSRFALSFLWGSAILSIILVLWQGRFFQHPAAQAGVGAAMGGATSNLYDRLRCGTVIDFVDVGWWPVFNLADVAITLGAMTALWFIR
jgi:signal peptidase II